MPSLALADDQMTLEATMTTHAHTSNLQLQSAMDVADTVP